MPKIEMDVQTTLPPERVLAMLTDFTDKRPDIWPGLSRKAYRVYSVGENTADIREGNAPPIKVWAREHYEWSGDTVKWTVVESNFSAPGSYVEAKVTPRDGGSNVHITWDREGSNAIGRFFVKLIVRAKGKPVVVSVEKALRKAEASASAG